MSRPGPKTHSLAGPPDHAWWRDAIIYQIYPRSFCDSSGNGVGDLAGITRHLSYVASLGVDAIWISPFVASPQRDYGYDVSDYCAVDPLFGTLLDAQTLIVRAHALGLRVLMDQVWSHTSDEHPWFQNARQSRTAEKSDWYIWADPQADGTPPNNWLSVFGGPAWTWEPHRKQYYLNHFLPQQPALNLRHPAVQDALEAVARFWIALGVDGFRFDAVDFMAHDPCMANNPPRPGGPQSQKPYSFQHHIYDLAHGDTASILRDLRQRMPPTSWHHEPPLAIAEVGSELCRQEPLARAGSYTQPSPEPAAQMAYSLAMMKSGGSAGNLAALFKKAIEQADQGWLLWAFSNHDVERVVSRWGQGDHRAAPLLMALLLSLRGGVCLYQGEELGLPEADVPREALRDPVGITMWPEFKGRDGARTPFPWVATAPHGGFYEPDPQGQNISQGKKTAVKPWLPVDPAHLPLAVDLQRGNPASMLERTKALIAWRRSDPVLRWGDMAHPVAHGAILTFFRRYRGRWSRFCFNLSATPVAMPNTDGMQTIPWQAIPGVAGWQGLPAMHTMAPWGALYCTGEDSL